MARAYITLWRGVLLKVPGKEPSEQLAYLADRRCQSVVPAIQMDAIGYNEPLACK